MPSLSSTPTPDPPDLYAPGHLGELTSYLPTELIDDILEQTRTTQQRLRALPSRVGIYLVLAMSLFPHLGMMRVWDKLTTGLRVRVARPTEKALRDLRRRLTAAPFKALFEVIAGPLAWPGTPGVSYRGLRTVAFDGCHSLKAPDTPRVRAWLGRLHYRMGFAGYPTLHLMALVETGTRALIAATIGGAHERDEPTLATRLLTHLRPGMLVLADRAFDTNAFLTAVHDSGAHVLTRAKNTRNPIVVHRFPDGSYLSHIDGLAVRTIDAHLTATTGQGQRIADRYRLITTLTDPHRYPARELVALYHERWEIEIAFLGLRRQLLDGHVLRSQDQPGLEQEVWALLTVYQLLHHVMHTATSSQPGIDPDRACFTTARETARDQLILAAATPDPTDPPGQTGQIGQIGRHILATLLPPRRARTSKRKVKCATSRYLNRDDQHPEKSTPITTITITITPPPATPTRRPPPRTRPRTRRSTHPPRPATPTRRDRVTALMRTDPTRAWTGRELATHLDIPIRTLQTQLGQWFGLGFLTRTHTDHYRLPEQTEHWTTTHNP
jgi:Insertion element 4 transposase N-terminal/Transposase DDE domain